MSKNFNVYNEEIYIKWNKFKPYPILNEHPHMIENLDDYTEERVKIEKNLSWYGPNEKRVQPFRIDNIYYNVDKNVNKYEVTIPEDWFTEAEYGTIFRIILPKIKELTSCDSNKLTANRETKLFKNKYSNTSDELNHPKFYYMFTKNDGKFLTLYSLLYIYNFCDDFINIKKKCIKYFTLLELYKGLDPIKDETKRPELVFRDKLYDILKPLGITMEWQYTIYVDNNMYKLDFFIPDYNLVIEYDEKAHKYRKSKDARRQKLIEKNYGYKFLRVQENDSDEFNIGLVIQNIISQKTEQTQIKHINKIIDACNNVQNEVKTYFEKNNQNLLNHIVDIKEVQKLPIIKRLKNFF